MATRADADVVDRLDELERTLEALRDDLRPRRGPMGLPRPPTPREVLRFTESYTIPTAIAVLEAQVRSLELLGEALRRVDGAGSASETGRRAERLGDVLLNRMDDTLAEIQRAIEEGSLPDDPTARRLVAEARELNADLRADVERATREVEGRERRGDREREDAGGVNIDVEEELRTLKDDADQTGSNR